MGKSKSLPDFVLQIGTYAELERYARAFAEGHLNLMLLFGSPGVGKSQCIHRALGDKACWIDGNATAFGIYLAAYEHRHQPIALDDIDGLYRDRNGVRLLKALAQTNPLKSLSWQSDARTLDRLGIPRQFTTSSRTVIIGNAWKTLNDDVAALEDRGHFLHFTPSATEVHRQASNWYWDQEVFDFIAGNLHLIEQHSLRTYVLAWEFKKAGLDWRQMVLSRCLTGPALEVARLQADASFTTEEDRVRAFVESGVGCRATYFNHSKKLQPTAAPGPIPLIQTAPPSVNVAPPEDLLDRLRRRFGDLGNG